jgi:hypothetical protein
VHAQRSLPRLVHQPRTILGQQSALHRASVSGINKSNVPTTIYEASKQCWDEALAHGENTATEIAR